MKNHWVKEGDEIRIALKRGGRLGKEYIWTRIDAADFDKVNAFPGRWVPKWNDTAHTFYARNNGTYGWKAGYMHRVILKVTERKVQIDHDDHDGLNNRRANLIKSNVKLNGFNRRGPEIGSTTGKRNVYWHPLEQKYKVGFAYNGVKYHFGTFADINEAEAVAIRERAKILQRSAAR